ncbi:MAG: hypothetical protein BWY72_02432 [Bacteroidetes bacterium ADurb.Bin416]|nr:MAG: hypothetical protein BWY72_02432 [Bacteroidetes bacterium ADurb.Bin416]
MSQLEIQPHTGCQEPIASFEGTLMIQGGAQGGLLKIAGQDKRGITDLNLSPGHGLLKTPIGISQYELLNTVPFERYRGRRGKVSEKHVKPCQPDPIAASTGQYG